MDLAWCYVYMHIINLMTNQQAGTGHGPEKQEPKTATFFAIAFYPGIFRQLPKRTKTKKKQKKQYDGCATEAV